MKKYIIIVSVLLLTSSSVQSASVFDYSGNQAQNQMSSPFLRFEFDKPIENPETDTVKNTCNWGRYIRNLQHKLNSQLILKKNSPIALEFDIARDGSIANLQVTTSSANSEFDKYVKATIETSSPFAQLPSKYKGDKIKVKLNIYNGAMRTSVVEYQ